MNGAMARGTVAGAARGARGADDWVERVRAASDIVEVIRPTVSLKRVGRNWTGLCPFHQEKTPSFSVHAERQFYHCFSCKAGGDVFKFVQETEKVGFREAVELLSRRAGIPVPDVRGGGVERGLKARLLEALEAAAVCYEQWLGDPTAGAQARATSPATRRTWCAPPFTAAANSSDAGPTSSPGTATSGGRFANATLVPAPIDASTVAPASAPTDRAMARGDSRIGSSRPATSRSIRASVTERPVTGMSRPSSRSGASGRSL